jgi:hypothetical protein
MVKRSPNGSLYYKAKTNIEAAYYYTARFVGFIHPLNATAPDGERLKIWLGLQNAQAMLYLSVDETETLQVLWCLWIVFRGVL